MEPPNKGHVGTRSFVLYKEVSFIRRLKYTGIIGIEMSRFGLYREGSFIRRLKCIGIIGIETSRFGLYREVFFIRGVLYRRFHCNTGRYNFNSEGSVIVYSVTYCGVAGTTRHSCVARLEVRGVYTR